MATRSSSPSTSQRRRTQRGGGADSSQLSLFGAADVASTSGGADDASTSPHAPAEAATQVAPTADLEPAQTRGEVDAAGTGAVATAAPIAPGTALPAVDHDTTALADAMRAGVLRWSASRGATAAQAQAAADAAAALVAAQHEGHVCIRIEGGAARRGLLASKVVAEADDQGACDADLPFVIDAAGRLYLQRVFDDERAIAYRLAAAGRVEMPGGPLDKLRLSGAGARGRSTTSGRTQVQANGGAAAGEQADRQALAAALALLTPVLVISGGPGTGKTTTLARILGLVTQQNPALRIALAAPTGKAAARMTQALAQARSAALDPSSDTPTAPRARTVHAWLGVHPRTGIPRHDARNPLPADLIVVDEASMLDLELARKLFDALPAHARIVLLGDKDQLAAVQAGAVFAELSSKAGASLEAIERAASLSGVPPDAAKAALLPAAAAGGQPAGHAVVHLVRSYRFDAGSTIARLAGSVRDGDADAAIALLHESRHNGGDVAWLAPGGDIAPGLAIALRPYLDALDALLAHGDDADDAAIVACLAALDAWRPLCAVHDGPSGTRAWNARASLLVRHGRGSAQRRPAGTTSSDPWFTGRAVMVTRNDPTLGLVNGDVGIVLPLPLARPREDPSLRHAAFLRPDGHIARWPVARLPAAETAFATSVHKAQGSEFDRVTLVLPTPWQRPCTRELVYTAVTRARAHVTLVADEASLRASIAARTERLGGLGDRLRAAGATHREEPTS